MDRHTLLEKKESDILILCAVADMIRSYEQYRFINLVGHDKRNFAEHGVLSERNVCHIKQPAEYVS